MDGNITKLGIRLDLEWMHRAGLGGVQIFDGALETPQVVAKRLIYQTPKWKEAFKFATVFAHQLGLEESIASSPGFSETGGPWVPASHGMKKYVWSETEVKGGDAFRGHLRHPPVNGGAFQNLPVNDVVGSPAGYPGVPEYYADSIVVAYPKPPGDVSLESLHPKISVSDGAPDFSVLTDGDLTTCTVIPIPVKVGESGWVEYEFPEPQSLRAVTIVAQDPSQFQQLADGVGAPDKIVEASDDGKHFRQVAKVAGSDQSPEFTLAFPTTTAGYFRIRFQRTSPPAAPRWAAGGDLTAFGTIPPTPIGYELCELVLHAGARVNRWEEKAAFVPALDSHFLATPSVGTGLAIPRSDVIDLTSKMKPDGSLEWIPPPGEWVVLRFGYSLLGILNHPASAEATGLEVDKLNRDYVRQYIDTYLDSYRDTVGQGLIGQGGVRNLVTDSWEAGSQNWTENMIDEFRMRRGYDPLPWMAVLTGRVVDSAEASDHFLWDFRKTIADLIADNHYGQLAESVRARGMGYYSESHEDGRAFVGDGMEVKKFSSIPMAAMWTQSVGENQVQYGYNADDRESASVAHIYGQNIAAAESLTAFADPWAWSPATLKPTVDQEFSNGINRIVIHESAHQPLLNRKPGMTLGPFGQWFNRNETWAEQSRVWVDYIARSSFLLQQGRFVADIIYFYGEDSNLTAIFSSTAPDIPVGYGFDYINADGLIHKLSVADSRLVTASGMSYRMLVLGPRSQRMSLPVLRAIHELVENGAIVAGPKPLEDTSLADDVEEFHKLSDEIFGDGRGKRRVGQGTVFAGETPGEAIKSMDLMPDFDYAPSQPGTSLLFVHRRLRDGDLYFVNNRNDRYESVDASFRVMGRAPELWYADTGRRLAVSYRAADGRTTIPLRLEPWGAIFIVFRKPTNRTSRVFPPVTETALATLHGAWRIHFQADRGAPALITMRELESWTRSSDAGVKYFSGAATYSTVFQASAGWFKDNAQLWLDLGDVRNLAEATLNGKPLGIVWHAPYRLDVTAATRPGANLLKIKVINAWVNRLIGDQQPGTATPVTYADVKPYSANSPLLESGLLGPVTVVSTH